MALAVPGMAGAQEGSIDLDAGAIHALPPAGAPGSASSYILVGGRVHAPASPLFSLDGRVYGGLSLDPQAGDWVSAGLGANLWKSIGGGVGVGVAAGGSAFRVGDPSSYRAAVLELEPEVRVALGPTTMRLWGSGGAGQSRVELDPPGAPGDSRATSVTTDLWTLGGGLALRRTLGDVFGRVGAEAVSAATGAFASAFAGASGRVEDATWSVEIRWWDTPGESEAAFTAAIGIPLGGDWGASVSGGRYGPQPLLDAPAATSGAAIVTWRALELGAPREARVTSVYEILADRAAGEARVVRFALPAPGAESVTLVGAFTGWREVALGHRDGSWVLELAVEPGVYRFGFRVDGRWHVPDGTSVSTTDEWGRETLLLIVPEP